MKKINLLFALILSLVGFTQVKAATLTENFNSLTASGTTLSNGWFVQGATLGTQGSSAGNWGSYSYELASRDEDGTSGKSLVAAYGSQAGYVIIPTDLTGTISFRITGTKTSAGSYSIHSVTESGGTYTVGSALTSGTVAKKSDSRASFGTWTTVTYNYSGHSMIALMFNKAAIDNFSAEIYEETNGPALVVKADDAKITSPYSYDFGLATAGTTKTFTLSNPGTEDLTVSIDGGTAFGATLSATTIAAGGEATLTLTMPEETASETVTIKAQSDDIDDFVINVSGTVKDPNKFYEGFLTGALPEGWEEYAGSTYYSWTYGVDNVGVGYAGYEGSSSSYYGTLTSPQLNFSAGEKLFFNSSKYGSSTWYTPSISVQYSADGENWTTIETITSDVNGQWTTHSVTIPNAGLQYIRFYGWYFYITDIYGGEVPSVANMKVDAADVNYGMVSADATSTFKIRNIGGAELTGIQVTSNNAAFTIADAPTTVAAGGEATVTVTFSAANKGAQSGVITVTAPDQTSATFNVSGYVLDTDVIVVDFAGNAIPEGWTNSGFEVSNNEISTTYNTRTLTSPAITVEEGQTLAIYAKGGSTWGASLTVKTSKDNGATWTNAKAFTTELQQNTTDYVVLLVDNIAAGNYRLQLEGYYVTINTINGYTYNMNAPVLEVTPADAAAFGKVKAQPEAKTYTVSNAGTGTLSVAIASDSEDFTVSPASLEVAAGESATFTVNLIFDEENFGEKSATITVTPSYDESAAVTIAATAITADPNVWDEDFEEGSLPTTWDNEGNWTVSQPSASGNNGTYMANISSFKNPKALTTPRLEAKAGDQLTFYIGMQYDDEPLTIEYSNDDKTTWQVIEAGTASYTESGDITFTAPEDGYYNIRFTGTYAMLDNFKGFKEAPLTHDIKVESVNIPATGNQYVEYTASVTVKEMAGKSEELTVSFFIGDEQYGDDVVETIEANGEKTYTVTFTPNEAIENGDAYFTITEDNVFDIETEHQVVNIAAAPVLDETVGSLDDFENFGNYPAITLKYSLKAGWNTIVLPFAVSDLSVFGEGVKAYSFNGYSEAEGLQFKAETSLNAQQPYVLYATEAKSEFTFTNVTSFRTAAEATDINTSKNDVTFQGTYAPVAAGGMEGKYGVVPSTGRIQKGSANATLKGFRAYFELPAGVDGAKLNINYEGEDGSVTAIKGIDILTGGEEGAIFDLSGRKQSTTSLPAGIYVKNGKKYVAK